MSAGHWRERILIDEIINNVSMSRYELPITDDAVAVAYYSLEDGRVVLRHTEVPSEYGGQGIGKTLVQATLDLIRASGEKVVPVCPFVAAWMKRHPEYDDLRADAAQ